MRREAHLAARPPAAGEPRRALRARRDERGVAQDLRAQPPDRRRQRTVDVLGRLDAERDAAAPSAARRHCEADSENGSASRNATSGRARAISAPARAR